VPYLRLIDGPGDPFLSALRRAGNLFRDFHNFAAGPTFLYRLRPKPRVLVRLGWLKGLIYSSDRGQCGRPRTFIHFMRTPPVLATNPEGNQLHILGGRYRVTRNGIVG
jgi:hypothetical protein